MKAVTKFDAAINAATAAAEELAVALLEEAVSRCRSEELERCDDWHGVFDLVDDAAWQIYNEGMHQRVCRILTAAGIDLPIDPQTHGFGEDLIVVEAVAAAGDELATIRFGEMPTSVGDALRLAIARVRYERQLLCRTTDGDDAGVIEDRLNLLAYQPNELELLVGMGIVVVRAGHPALPFSDEGLSQAYRALQDWLVSDVRTRLGSYCDPIAGCIDVCDVTLTAEEETAVRAAAMQIDVAAA